MSSKRHLRRRSCESKIKHLSENSAFNHAKSLGFGYFPYRCQFCSAWHVGRPNSRKLQSIKAKLRNVRAML